MMNPRIDCSQSPLEVRLLPEEIVELDVRDEKRMKEWGLFASQHVRPGPQPPHDGKVYQCGGGINSFAVDPYGGMSICVLSQNDKFDLRAGSVRLGWEEFLHKVRTRKVTQATKCVGCGLKSLCGMCPANGELENGDPEAPVDWLCQTAHLRAMALDIPIPAHGACEYCAGGSAHAHVVDAAARLRLGARAVEPPPATMAKDGNVFLRVVNAPSSLGCGSCGTH